MIFFIVKSLQVGDFRDEKKFNILYRWVFTDCAYGSKLLAYASHTVAICKRMLHIRQQFASIHCAYGNKSSNILCFAGVCCVCGSQLLAYAVHAVAHIAHCQRILRMRQQFATVDGACGSKNKMARISPICKKCKIFISSLKSPAYRDFMLKIH